jgi:hypothetical protein
MRVERLKPIGALIAVLLGAAGCPGVLEDPDRFRTGSCPDIETELFPQRCATADCHSAMDEAGRLDLQSPGVLGRLIEVNAMGDECVSSGRALLVPGEPDDSLLFLKLQDNPPCGAKMPFALNALSPSELGCVATWIRGLEDLPDAGGEPPVDAGTSD